MRRQDGFQLWSERYDRELKDIFDVQDEIARAIAERLKVTLADGANAARAQGDPNVDAYERYLKGRALLTRRGPQHPGRRWNSCAKSSSSSPISRRPGRRSPKRSRCFGYYGTARPENVRHAARIDAAAQGD